MREIHHDGRKETALGQSQQEADGIEFCRAVNQAGKGSQPSPTNHDGGDPFPGAPGLRQHGAGNFQETISEEEYARAEAKNFVRKMQLASHVQTREADVHAIDERRNVEQKQKWNQPPRNFASCRDAASAHLHAAGTARAELANGVVLCFRS